MCTTAIIIIIMSYPNKYVRSNCIKSEVQHPDEGFFFFNTWLLELNKNICITLFRERTVLLAQELM